MHLKQEEANVILGVVMTFKNAPDIYHTENYDEPNL